MEWGGFSETSIFIGLGKHTYYCFWARDIVRVIHLYGLSGVIVRVCVVLKRLLVTVNLVTTTCAEVIFSDFCNVSGWYLCLVIDLIGQLNSHVIGCKTCKRWSILFRQPIQQLVLRASWRRERDDLFKIRREGAYCSGDANFNLRIV